MNYSECLLFDQLSETSKDIARVQIIACQQYAFTNAVSKGKLRAKQSIHSVINYRSHSSVLNQAKLVAKLKDRDYLDKVIKANLCEFTASGHYYRIHKVNGIMTYKPFNI